MYPSNSNKFLTFELHHNQSTKKLVAKIPKNTQEKLIICFSGTFLENEAVGGFF